MKIKPYIKTGLLVSVLALFSTATFAQHHHSGGSHHGGGGSFHGGSSFHGGGGGGWSGGGWHGGHHHHNDFGATVVVPGFFYSYGPGYYDTYNYDDSDVYYNADTSYCGYDAYGNYVCTTDIDAW